MSLTLLTRSQKSLKPFAIGGMKWTSNLYGPVDLKQSENTLRLALDHQYTHIDTADCYLGSDGYPHNEVFIGSVLKSYFEENTINRSDVFISTKCGIKLDPLSPWKRDIDISPKYIKDCCQKSLERLNTTYLDLFYLHRINEINTPIEKSMEAFYELKEMGLVRYIGLSEVNVKVLSRADAHLRQLSDNRYGIDAVQTEYNLLSKSPETNGIFEYCSNKNIVFFAYSPLCRGLGSGKVPIFNNNDCRLGLARFKDQNLEHNLNHFTQLSALAEKYNTSIAVISLSWILYQARHFHINICPIIGTADPSHLMENISAQQLSLKPCDIDKINNIFKPGAAWGARYPELDMQEFCLE